MHICDLFRGIFKHVLFDSFVDRERRKSRCINSTKKAFKNGTLKIMKTVCN